MEVFPVLSRSNNIGDENGMHADAGLSNFLYKDAILLGDTYYHAFGGCLIMKRYAIRFRSTRH